MLSEEILTKIRIDSEEFKKQWQSAKTSDEKTEILKALKPSVSPEVARLVLSSSEYSIDAKTTPDPEFGSLYGYFLKETVKELPYDEAIFKILTFYDDQPKIGLKIITYLLKTDPNFKENFRKDDKYLPLFKSSLTKSLLATNDPDLLSISKDIEKLTLNKEFAFSIMRKIFNYEEPLTNEQQDVINIALDAKTTPDSEFGSLYGYFLKETIKDLSYDEAIFKILTFYDRQPKIGLKIITYLLKTDPNFKENFCKDDKYLPLFKSSLTKSLLATNDPDLLSISEDIEKLKLNNEFAFSIIRKIFNSQEPLTTEQQDAINIALDAKTTPDSEFGSLYGYFLKETIKDLSYDKAILKILNFYDRQPKIGLKIIIYLLKTDPNFKENFCKDDKYLPLFKGSLTKSLLATNDPDLLSISEDIEKLKLNKEFAFPIMLKIFNYQEPLTTEQQDAINIALFLNDTDAVEHQLSKLEKILEDRAAARWDADKKSLIDYQKGKILDHKKLFSSYLFEWARENNFPNYAKIYKIVHPDAFLEALKLSSLIIDKGFRGFQHGEWIHIVQVLCFVEYSKEMKKNNQEFILNSPPDIIKWIGEQDSSIWDRIFDEVKSYDFWPKNGWRDPFNASHLLSSQDYADKFPILYQLITGRALKSSKSYSEKPPLEIWETSTLDIKKK